MSYWGDNLRFFVGRVERVDGDPQGRGRVQVRIFGIHSQENSDIDTKDLPWAEILMGTNEGGVSGKNSSGGPGIIETASVFGVFLDGKASQLPMVMGVLPKIDSIQAFTPRAEELFNSGNPEIVTSTQSVPNQRPGQRTQQGFAEWGGAFVPEQARSAVEKNPNDMRTKRLALMYFFTKQEYTNEKGKKEKRFSPTQAAAIVGNLQAESNFNQIQSSVRSSFRSGYYKRTFPQGLQQLGIQEDLSREPSYGIAQWNANAGRLDPLIAFAKKYGKGRSWDDLWVQAEFICWSCYGQAGDNTGGSAFKAAYGDLRATQKCSGGSSNTNGTWVWMQGFEKPASPESKISGRDTYALEALSDYENAIAQS